MQPSLLEQLMMMGQDSDGVEVLKLLHFVEQSGMRFRTLQELVASIRSGRVEPVKKSVKRALKSEFKGLDGSSSLVPQLLAAETLGGNTLHVLTVSRDDTKPRLRPFSADSTNAAEREEEDAATQQMRKRKAVLEFLAGPQCALFKTEDKNRDLISIIDEGNPAEVLSLLLQFNKQGRKFVSITQLAEAIADEKTYRQDVKELLEYLNGPVCVLLPYGTRCQEEDMERLALSVGRRKGLLALAQHVNHTGKQAKNLDDLAQLMREADSPNVGKIPSVSSDSRSVVSGFLSEHRRALMPRYDAPIGNEEVEQLLQNGGPLSASLLHLEQLMEAGATYANTQELTTAVRLERLRSFEHKKAAVEMVLAPNSKLVKDRACSSGDVEDLYERQGVGKFLPRYVQELLASKQRFQSWSDLALTVAAMHAQQMRARQACRDILAVHLTGPTCGLLSADSHMSKEQLSRILEEAGSGPAAMQLLQLLDTGAPALSPAALLEAVRRAANEDGERREDVSAFLLSEECNLLPGVAITDGDVTRLYEVSGARCATLVLLKALNADKLSFSSFGELTEAVQDLHFQSFYSPRCDSLMLAAHLLGGKYQLLERAQPGFELTPAQLNALTEAGAGQGYIALSVLHSLELNGKQYGARFEKLLSAVKGFFSAADSTADEIVGFLTGPSCRIWSSLGIANQINGEKARRLIAFTRAGKDTLQYIRSINDTGVPFDSFDALVRSVSAAHTRAMRDKYNLQPAPHTGLLLLPSRTEQEADQLRDQLLQSALLPRNAAAHLSDQDCELLVQNAGTFAALLSYLAVLEDSGARFPDVAALTKGVRAESFASFDYRRDLHQYLNRPTCALLCKKGEDGKVARAEAAMAHVDEVYEGGCAGAATLERVRGLEKSGKTFFTVEALTSAVKYAQQVHLQSRRSEQQLVRAFLAQTQLLKEHPLHNATAEEVSEIMVACNNSPRLALSHLKVIAARAQLFDSFKALVEAIRVAEVAAKEKRGTFFMFLMKADSKLLGPSAKDLLPEDMDVLLHLHKRASVDAAPSVMRHLQSMQAENCYFSEFHELLKTLKQRIKMEEELEEAKASPTAYLVPPQRPKPDSEEAKDMAAAERRKLKAFFEEKRSSSIVLPSLPTDEQIETLRRKAEDYGSPAVRLLEGVKRDVRHWEELLLSVDAHGSRRARRKQRLQTYLTGHICSVFEGAPRSVPVTHEDLETLLNACPSEGVLMGDDVLTAVIKLESISAKAPSMKKLTELVEAEVKQLVQDSDRRALEAQKADKRNRDEVDSLQRKLADLTSVYEYQKQVEVEARAQQLLQQKIDEFVLVVQTERKMYESREQLRQELEKLVKQLEERSGKLQAQHDELSKKAQQAEQQLAAEKKRQKDSLAAAQEKEAKARAEVEAMKPGGLTARERGKKFDELREAELQAEAVTRDPQVRKVEQELKQVEVEKHRSVNDRRLVALEVDIVKTQLDKLLKEQAAQAEEAKKREEELKEKRRKNEEDYQKRLSELEEMKKKAMEQAQSFQDGFDDQAERKALLQKLKTLELWEPSARSAVEQMDRDALDDLVAQGGGDPRFVRCFVRLRVEEEERFKDIKEFGAALVSEHTVWEEQVVRLQKKLSAPENTLLFMKKMQRKELVNLYFKTSAGLHVEQRIMQLEKEKACFDTLPNLQGAVMVLQRDYSKEQQESRASIRGLLKTKPEFISNSTQPSIKQIDKLVRSVGSGHDTFEIIRMLCARGEIYASFLELSAAVIDARGPWQHKKSEIQNFLCSPDNHLLASKVDYSSPVVAQLFFFCNGDDPLPLLRVWSEEIHSRRRQPFLALEDLLLTMRAEYEFRSPTSRGKGSSRPVPQPQQPSPTAQQPAPSPKPSVPAPTSPKPPAPASTTPKAEQKAPVEQKAPAPSPRKPEALDPWERAYMRIRTACREGEQHRKNEELNWCEDGVRVMKENHAMQRGRYAVMYRRNLEQATRRGEERIPPPAEAGLERRRKEHEALRREQWKERVQNERKMERTRYLARLKDRSSKSNLEFNYAVPNQSSLLILPSALNFELPMHEKEVDLLQTFTVANITHADDRDQRTLAVIGKKGEVAPHGLQRTTATTLLVRILSNTKSHIITPNHMIIAPGAQVEVQVRLRGSYPFKRRQQPCPHDIVIRTKPLSPGDIASANGNRPVSTARASNVRPDDLWAKLRRRVYTEQNLSCFWPEIPEDSTSAGAADETPTGINAMSPLSQRRDQPTPPVPDEAQLLKQQMLSLQMGGAARGPLSPSRSGAEAVFGTRRSSLTQPV